MNSLPSDPTQAAGTAVTMHTRVHDTAGISCGEFLRRARERRRLTLQQIAQSTKIPLRHLDALERDEFEALPSGMYRRAEVRAYADAVGLDRSVALASLDRTLEQAMPSTASVPPPTFTSGRTRVLIAASMAVTAGAIALAMWARQPGAGDITSLAAPVSPPASSVVRAPHAPNHVLVATSGSTVELASAPPRRRTRARHRAARGRSATADGALRRDPGGGIHTGTPTHGDFRTSGRPRDRGRYWLGYHSGHDSLPRPGGQARARDQGWIPGGGTGHPARGRRSHNDASHSDAERRLRGGP